MSAIDALLGRIFSRGTELELRGGINASTGLQAVGNSATNRVDLSVDFLRALALGAVNLSSSSATPLTATVWSEIAGTFALGGASGSLWTLASSGAGLVWGGSEAVSVLSVASINITAAGANVLSFGLAVDGTVEGDYDAEAIVTDGVGRRTTTQLLSVDPGETVSAMLRGLYNGNATVDHLTMIVAALGAT
jgi:hypothetical protein